MKCCADRCQGEGWEYGIANAFSMEKWERRMEKVSSNKTATAETGDSHTAPILGVKYNSLGSLLATCSEDNTVRISELVVKATDEFIKTTPSPSPKITINKPVGHISVGTPKIKAGAIKV